MKNNIVLAFWNVENLFDVENAQRPEKIQKAIAKDIEKWNDELLNAKLSQLSKVIRSINSKNGPDILGVCEVENKNVLEKLIKQIENDGGRKYNIAHADTSDNRGIDIAFLYDPQVAKFEQFFQHWIVKRYATRELFQVNFIVNEKKFVVIGNHWPSRTAGQYESEPYRMTAGETLSYWMQRIYEELSEDVAIVVMGDFNDEPFNRSITEYALAVNDSNAVVRGRNPYLFNLMWPILSDGIGSHFYSGQWNLLDQIMISKGITNGKSGWIINEKPKVEAMDIMSIPGKIGPRKFGIKPKERDKEGFSDHFPVSIKLDKK